MGLLGKPSPVSLAIVQRRATFSLDPRLARHPGTVVHVHVGIPGRRGTLIKCNDIVRIDRMGRIDHLLDAERRHAFIVRIHKNIAIAMR